MKLTFICCYNNREELERMLLTSFTRVAGKEHNIILIDTLKENCKSAAEAYNNAIKRQTEAIGDIVLFCHQDIAFDDCCFIDNIVRELKEEPNQILGFAGITSDGTVVSNLKYRKSNKFITRNRALVKTEVCSVDECCFATKKETFMKFWFDEKVCNHWHLYAVDICYNAKRKGIKSYVMPETIYHKEDATSGQRTDNYFINCMWHLILKYKNCFKKIYAPCYICSTNPVTGGFRLLKTFIKNITIK